MISTNASSTSIPTMSTMISTGSAMLVAPPDPMVAAAMIAADLKGKRHDPSPLRQMRVKLMQKQA